MKAAEFLLNLISRDTRESSTRFAYFAIIIAVLLVILACVFVIILDSLKPAKVSFDFFTGIAEIIFACAGLVIAAGIPKALTDFSKKKNE